MRAITSLENFFFNTFFVPYVTTPLFASNLDDYVIPKALSHMYIIINYTYARLIKILQISEVL